MEKTQGVFRSSMSEYKLMQIELKGNVGPWQRFALY